MGGTHFPYLIQHLFQAISEELNSTILFLVDQTEKRNAMIKVESSVESLYVSSPGFSSQPEGRSCKSYRKAMIEP